jgi:hypothetical protein
MNSPLGPVLNPDRFAVSAHGQAVEASEETSETDEARQRTPLSMIVPAVALVAGVACVGGTLAFSIR